MSKILNRFTREVMYEDKSLSIRELCEIYKKDLRGANLYGANLRDINLIDGDLRHTIMAQADLRGADLKGVKLQGTGLQGCLFDNNIFDANWGLPTDGYTAFILLSLICPVTPDIAQAMLCDRGFCWNEAKELFNEHPELHDTLKEKWVEVYEELRKNYVTGGAA